MGFKRWREQFIKQKISPVLLDEDSAHFVFIGHSLNWLDELQNVLSFRIYFQEGVHPPPTPSQSPLTVA